MKKSEFSELYAVQKKIYICSSPMYSQYFVVYLCERFNVITISVVSGINSERGHIKASQWYFILTTHEHQLSLFIVRPKHELYQKFIYTRPNNYNNHNKIQRRQLRRTDNDDKNDTSHQVSLCTNETERTDDSNRVDVVVMDYNDVRLSCLYE